jgi:hypothetical protein
MKAAAFSVTEESATSPSTVGLEPVGGGLGPPDGQKAVRQKPVHGGRIAVQESSSGELVCKRW